MLQVTTREAVITMKGMMWMVTGSCCNPVALLQLPSPNERFFLDH